MLNPVTAFAPRQCDIQDRTGLLLLSLDYRIFTTCIQDVVYVLGTLPFLTGTLFLSFISCRLGVLGSLSTLEASARCSGSKIKVNFIKKAF